MKRIMTIAATALMAQGLWAASLTATGSQVVKETVAASTGLEAVYVCRTMDGVTLTYTPTDASATVTWRRYSTLGGAHYEDVTPTTRLTLDNPEGDMGYIVTESSATAGDVQTAVWVVDYSKHRFTCTSLEGSAAEKDCGVTVLDFTGSGAAITYYDINGRQLTLSRQIKIAYHTLAFNEAMWAYDQTTTSETVDAVTTSTIRVPAALCATTFTLTGDKWEQVWGEGVTVTSQFVEPYAVEAMTEAEQTNEVASNNSAGISSSLGGSAPAVIEFRAAVTDAAVFREWQFSSSSNFDDVDLRVSQLEYTHTFNDQGYTYVRFVCDNAEGTCEYTSATYEVYIGESALLCSNAFSPGASEGVNDEWKVSYKSLVEFDCSIFNRAGKRMAHLTDPSQGWDGRYSGKLVPAGVYYYVIRAKGSDGKEYKLSGDINIVNYK